MGVEESGTIVREVIDIRDERPATVVPPSAPAPPSPAAAASTQRVRQVAAAALPFAVFVAPIVAAAQVAIVASLVVDRPPGTAAGAVWFAAVLAASVLAASLAQRLVRRSLSLVHVLRLALVIPVDVGSRLGLALRAHTLRDLEAGGVIDLRDVPSADPADAAARIISLAADLQRHDRFTRGHSERVRAYTDLLSEAMGLSRSDREKLRWAALLHDIGKTAVSPAILNKPAKLDDAEWGEMQHHAAAGTRLGEELRPYLGAWVDAIGQHHEKFDGSGYPLGLAGEEISLGARIVAVADSYEVMTATRPYKKPMSHQAARQELVAQAGRHFDPSVVRAMLDLSVRRLRWAAGPQALIGDVVGVKLAGWARPEAGFVSTALQILPTAAVSAVVVGATSLGAVAGDPAEVVPPVPTVVSRADPATPAPPAGAPVLQGAAPGAATSVGAARLETTATPDAPSPATRAPTTASDVTPAGPLAESERPAPPPEPAEPAGPADDERRPATPAVPPRDDDESPDGRATPAVPAVPTLPELPSVVPDRAVPGGTP